MRAVAGGLAGAGRALRDGGATLFAAAALGVLAGLAWGVADDPVYGASSSVVVEAAAEPPLEPTRVAELAASRAVATEAARQLGDDVPGADLLASTAAEPGEGVVAIDARSEVAEFAAASADAFAAATVEVVGARERRSLRRARDGLREELDGLDPDGPEAAELADRIADLDQSLEGGPPLAVGAAAELPSDPVESRSTPLAALVGGVLAAAAAALVLLALELRRRPVRSSREAVGGAALPTIPIDPPAEGADPGSSPKLPDAAPLVAALGLERLEGGPATVAVASPSPGEGRTTTAAALALAAAARGRRVILLEADLRSPRLTELLGLATGPGLVDYLVGDVGPQEVLRGVELAERHPGSPGVLVCVPAGEAVEADPAELLESERFSALVERVARVYDLVVVDTPPLERSLDAQIVLETAGAAVLCCRKGVSRRAPQARAAGALAKLDPVVCGYLGATAGGGRRSTSAAPAERA